MSLSKQFIFFVLLFFFQFTYSQNDCTTALVACGNANYNNLSVTGSGNDEEISNLNTCGGQETNSLWIKVNIKTSGTLGFKLTPENHDIDIDFDFYVFGPTASCGNLGNAIRCSTTNPKASNANNNSTGMNGNETDTTEGPGADGNNFVNWLTVQAGETYYIVIDRFVGDTNFSIDWTGTATFNQPPTLNNTTNGITQSLSNCDSDTILDGSTSFDLTQNETLVIGSQPNVTATFHTSENDAITGENPIANPNNYQNTSNPQIVFIRLKNTVTDCFSTAQFNLNVIPFQAPDPVNIEECDLDNNGFATFNLTDNNTVLINGNPNIAVTYHPSADDAIVLPNSYTNQNAFTNETVWAKIRNTATGCYIYKSFQIIVNKIPNTTLAQLTQCDFEIFPNGLTTFNLEEANGTLTNNDANLSTKFYANLTDAQNDTNTLNANYSNVSNPQVLEVRVTNNTTHCYAFTQVILNVNTNPTQTVTLKECDEDGTEDGITTFNLADAGFETPGNTVTYYSNTNDALLEQNAITTMQFGSQTIYARIENGNDCIGLNIINLIVQPLPAYIFDNNEILCLNQPQKPVALNVNIVNPQLYSYFWTPNGETTQNIYAFNSGAYSVTVTNNASGCPKTMTTNVISSDIATILPTDIIDLVDHNTVTINASGPGDYWYSLDEASGPFQESNVFTDVMAGIHTIYVKDMNGCGVVSKEIYVLGVPKYFTPNGDGSHDYWNVRGVSAISNEKTTIYIFDRYGKLLKQISPLEQGWNGTFNGNQMPADDYWYSVQFEGGRTMKGNFALKR